MQKNTAYRKAYRIRNLEMLKAKDRAYYQAEARRAEFQARWKPISQWLAQQGRTTKLTDQNYEMRMSRMSRQRRNPMP